MRGEQDLESLSDNENEDLYLHLSPNSFLYVLTLNKGSYKSNVVNLIAKTFFLKEDIYICLLDLAKLLWSFNIKTLNIFFISAENREYYVKRIIKDNCCKLTYINIHENEYLNLLAVKNGDREFAHYNPHSLYILDNGSFKDIKRMINTVEELNVDIVRGSSQKSHVLSPLELRLSFYICAIFKGNYSEAFNTNSFNKLEKWKYLPGFNKRIINKQQQQQQII